MNATCKQYFATMLAVAMLFGTTSISADDPVLDGWTATIYATAIDPFELDFDSDGTLYAGHHSPSNGPAFIYEIAPGGGVAAEWGSAAPIDPDGIDVSAGSVYASSEGDIWQAAIPGGAMSVWATVSGNPNQSSIVVDDAGDYFPAGSVIVGNARFGTDIHVIDPATTLATSFATDSDLSVIRALQFVNGQLYLLETEGTKGVWHVDVNGIPTQVPDNGYSWSSIAAMVYEEDTDTFLVGGGTDLLRLPRTGGSVEVVGTGFESISGLAIDADGFVYVADVGADIVWQVGNLVVPFSAEVTRGTFVSGGVAELSISDNLDLSARRNVADIQSRVFLELTSVSPLAVPSSFEFTLEASVFARSTVEQYIDLWNYVTSDWEQVSVMDATRFTDSVTVATPIGDLSRFVEAGSRNIKARCRFQSLNPRQQFSANIDQTIWTIE